MKTKEDKLERLLCNVLDCEELGISILSNIEERIVIEARENLIDEDIPIEFPSLFYECAEIALHELHAISEIDSNYLSARVYLKNERKRELFEKLGFSVS